MGKSPKPLNLLIDPSLVQTDEDRQRLADLEVQGYSIDIQRPGHFMANNYEIDVILGPQCWRAFDLTYLDLAIKSARAVKYGKAKKPATPKARVKRATKRPGKRERDLGVVPPEIPAGGDTEAALVVAGRL